jgi:hypothetical protein
VGTGDWGAPSAWGLGSAGAAERLGGWSAGSGELGCGRLAEWGAPPPSSI